MFGVSRHNLLNRRQPEENLTVIWSVSRCVLHSTRLLIFILCKSNSYTCGWSIFMTKHFLSCNNETCIMSTNDKYVSWSGFADLSITKYLITSTKYGTGKNAFYCRPACPMKGSFHGAARESQLAAINGMPCQKAHNVGRPPPTFSGAGRGWGLGLPGRTSCTYIEVASIDLVRFNILTNFEWVHSR